jgi:protein-S-isoprenylcysteine O-methyltransferase Ste14
MKISERGVNYLYSIVTGNFTKRAILTPVYGTIYLFITVMFVVIPVRIDTLLKIPDFMVTPFSYILVIPLVSMGLFLIIWSNVKFFTIKGTPVPVNPPQKLIKDGPFAYSRNPMTTGYFFIMFGAGIYYSSFFSILIFTPLFIFIHVKYFKNIEEPELEKRLGKEYTEYKKKVPMFFPRKIKHTP